MAGEDWVSGSPEQSILNVPYEFFVSPPTVMGEGQLITAKTHEQLQKREMDVT